MKLIPIILLVILASCTAPTPFRDGAEVPAPAGCIEARTRGVNC